MIIVLTRYQTFESMGASHIRVVIFVYSFCEEIPGRQRTFCTGKMNTAKSLYIDKG